MAKPYAIVDNAQGDFKVETLGSLSVPTYQYDKLPSQGDHFRLLELFPGEGGRLDCKIVIDKIYDSEKPCRYTALSYCWQNPQFDNLVIGGKRIAADDPIRSTYQICHSLWCNDKRILISTSLRDALHELLAQSGNQTVRLWVDALCINQDDLAERASQVLLMQQIYHNATEVCMWLGREDEFSSLTFQLLGTLASLDTRRPGQQQELINPQAMQRMGVPVFPSEDWEALTRLLERPYFRRIWILQEMIAASLGSKLYCGGLEPLPWTALTASIIFLDRSKWISQIEAQYLSRSGGLSLMLSAISVGVAWMKGASTPAERLLIRREAITAGRRFDATDPRDKIFALIGIINDFGHRDLFGEDSPEGLGGPQTVTKDGTVHATFKLDERGKSKEDIALEIMQSHHDECIKKLHVALLDVFRGCVRVADIILQPEEDYTTEPFLNEYAAITGKTISGLNYIGQFRKDFRNISLDHQRCADFAWNAFTMFSSGISSYIQLIAEFCETDVFVEICNEPEIIEEVSRFREATAWMVESLEPKPPSQAESSGSNDKAKIKTPLVVGDRATLDRLEYAIKFERQYPDWAWSAAGWTMPMYDKPVEQVYTEFMVKCIRDDGNLDILGDVEDSSSRKIKGLPSWVPDFSIPMHRVPFTKWRTGKAEGFYSASGSSKADPKWDVKDAGVLGLSGYKVDEIVALASKELKDDETEERLQEWTAMIDQFVGTTYPAGSCDKIEGLWRTLIGDRSVDGECPAQTEYGAHFDALQRVADVKEGMDSLSLSSSNTVVAGKETFVRATAEVMSERKLFVTKKGYIGAGPLSSRVGGGVYLLAGGHVPFVLRNESDTNLLAGVPRMSLVGDCYVHGIMHGEALLWKDFGWEDVQIV
ncbi:heterokaryon incompatibility protein-domain-containing protein [Podospora didyma]|uniref:Heterokaryon incompatibility protein-domain-containing protein n=1 Tax=Podospora didyma TaxID=330526 RepID=A0AAE0U3K0_9PEZI|nr:heterokaryon incompatibility protein-domain-containing protein [Podospora didyma]